MFSAAVWTGDDLEIVDALESRPVGAGEVRVRVRRSGICHSDLNMMQSPHTPTPIVLGHEGAGDVLELGADVTGWQVGDRVMIGTQTPCGQCRECGHDRPHNCDATWGFAPEARFAWRGQPVFSFANVSSFARETVVKASQLHAIGTLPYDEAALIGCAVSTGMGAAQILGRVSAGDRVAVFGVGGIGVNAIAGATLRGAEVTAIDVNQGREAAARHFGASRFAMPSPGESGPALAARLAQDHGPFDVALECSGAIPAVEAAIGCVKRGGRAVLVGMGASGGEARLPLDQVLLGREIVAVMNGGARPERDYPAYIAAAQQGSLDLAAQVSGVWPLAAINDAIAALKAGEVTRAVVDLDHQPVKAGETCRPRQSKRGE
jgi:S-(hydroxymethyl)glutathione dehydrogenase/alcohol dehydrogenase